MLYFDGESKPIALQGGTAPPVGDDRIALDQRLVHAVKHNHLAASHASEVKPTWASNMPLTPNSASDHPMHPSLGAYTLQSKPSNQNIHHPHRHQHHQQQQQHHHQQQQQHHQQPPPASTATDPPNNGLLNSIAPDISHQFLRDSMPSPATGHQSHHAYHATKPDNARHHHDHGGPPHYQPANTMHPYPQNRNSPLSGGMAPPYTTFATITNSAQSAAGNDGQASAPASSGSTRGGSGSGSSRGGSRGAKGSNSSSGSNQGASSNKRARGVSDDSDGDTDVDGGPKDTGATPSTSGDKRAGRRKIKIEYIEDKSRRHITFSKRKAGIMKKAFELSTLTGTQVLLLVVSETGLVYTFTTPKLQPLVTKPDGKNLIQACLNAPDAPESVPNPTADPNSYMNGGRPQNMIHYNPTEPQISPVDQAGAQMMSASPYGETQRRLSIQHGTPAAPAMNTAYFQNYYNPQTASAVAVSESSTPNSSQHPVSTDADVVPTTSVAGQAYLQQQQQHHTQNPVGGYMHAQQQQQQHQQSSQTVSTPASSHYSAYAAMGVSHSQQPSPVGGAHPPHSQAHLSHIADMSSVQGISGGIAPGYAQAAAAAAAAATGISQNPSPHSLSQPLPSSGQQSQHQHQQQQYMHNYWASAVAAATAVRHSDSYPANNDSGNGTGLEGEHQQ